MKKTITCILTLMMLFIMTTAAAASEEKQYTWVEGCSLKFVEVMEYGSDLNAGLNQAKGKWAAVVFQIVEGKPGVKEISEAAEEKVRLNNQVADSCIVRGVEIDLETNSAVAVGFVDVLFDVPADTVLSEAIATVDGEAVSGDSTTGQEEPVSFEFEGVTCHVIGFTENVEPWSEKLKEAEGKLVLLQLLTDEIDGDVEIEPLMDFLKENFSLNEYAPKQTEFSHMFIDLTKMILVLKDGTIDLFFDVPTDFDLREAIASFEGEPFDVPVEPDDMVIPEGGKSMEFVFE